jgi:hypothetical protein
MLKLTRLPSGCTPMVSLIFSSLVTPNWLAAFECFDEFGAAWYMGKRIIPLFLLPPSAKPALAAEVRAGTSSLFSERADRTASTSPV